MSYLLDSSAWLAHIGDEAGATEVESLFTSSQEVFVSTLSLFEVAQRLKNMRAGNAWEKILHEYKSVITKILIVDEDIALLAIAMREQSSVRLATVDALIAATAARANAVLVHRDPHFDGIPAKNLKLLRLPPK